jgi:hypothetical protein
MANGLPSDYGAIPAIGRAGRARKLRAKPMIGEEAALASKPSQV